MALLQYLVIFLLCAQSIASWKPPVDKTKCPAVRLSSNIYNIEEIFGPWYVVQYYASSEESEIYRCMRTKFSMPPNTVSVFMNFTYSFIDDPNNEQLSGNITWRIPNYQILSHWIHAEDPYEGVYNTYLLDVDKTWMLLLHCAEKVGTNRYLSSFIMSRTTTLPYNVISYLRDKLPKYDIDLQYMFSMDQTDCTPHPQPLIFQVFNDAINPHVKHPMNHQH